MFLFIIKNTKNKLIKIENIYIIEFLNSINIILSYKYKFNNSNYFLKFFLL